MDVEKIESDWTMFQNLTQKLEDENINTLLDEITGETYYPITIIAKDKSFDQRPDEEAQFVPGMEASVELVGEKRSIAEYIVKPFRKFQMEAFRER